MSHRSFVAHTLAALPLLAAISVTAPAQTPTMQKATPGVASTDSIPTVRIDSLLPLDQVIARALAVSPDVARGEQGVRTAHSARRVASAELLPTFSANSGLLSSNITGTPNSSTLPPSAFSAGLAASADLFTGGRRAADRARATADLGAATATNISLRYSLILDAQTAFYETLRAADLVDVARASTAQAEQGLRYARDRVTAGTTTRSDALRASLQLTTSRQQLLAAMDTLQTAAYNLGRLVGADGPVAARRPASLEPQPLSLSDSAIEQLAIDASPAVQSARAEQEADEAALRATRTQYVPDLRLTAGYNWAAQSPILGAVRPGWTLLLGTSYPLFDGFHREDEVIRADATAEVARVSAIDLTRQARTDAARLLSGLRFATQKIALANDGVAAATEDLRVQTERYRAGISTELDELTSELALTQAQIGLVAARYEYQLTRARIEALVGRSL